MPKLHELLAIEGSLEKQADKVRNDLIDTFNKKRHLFEEKRVNFISSVEGIPNSLETQSDAQTSVKKEFTLLQSFIVKAIDASYQIAEANTKARADIVLDNGSVLVANVPATSLLELEKRMSEIHSLISAVPTLDPAKGFSFDNVRNLYKARSVVKTRTRKERHVLIKYEATPQHPAQTEAYDKDVPIGTLEEQEWSGLLTPTEKSVLINRVEEIVRAVRRARSRANETEIDQSKKIAANLLSYIFQDTNPV